VVLLQALDLAVPTAEPGDAFIKIFIAGHLHQTPFGNAIGEMADSSLNANVMVPDLIAIRDEIPKINVPIENPYDVNKDRKPDHRWLVHIESTDWVTHPGTPPIPLSRGDNLIGDSHAARSLLADVPVRWSEPSVRQPFTGP